MSQSPKNFQDIIKIANNILVKATQNQLPLTPKAYHVLFEYFAGHNKDLKNDVDSVDKNTKTISNQQIEKIHDAYLACQPDKQLIENTSTATQKIVETVLQELLNTITTTEDYKNKLDGHSEKLESATKIAQVQDVIKGLINDTKMMSDSSSDMQKKLEKANSETRELRKKLQEAEKSAYTDALTDLHNRKSFDNKIGALMKGFQKNKALFAYIIFDIDFFKAFNDKYGHSAGDKVLQFVGDVLKANLSGRQFPARYGGEEFAVLLPETDIIEAMIIAEKLRSALAGSNLRELNIHESSANITASFGISQVDTGDTIATLMERADKALYLAKEAGRNNVKSQYDLA